MQKIQLTEDQLKFITDATATPSKYVWVDRTPHSKTIENPELRVSVAMLYGEWQSPTRREVDYLIYAW